MELTQKRKIALIAFLVFDVLVIAAFVILFQLRGERQREAGLREIGVTIYPEARALSAFELVDHQGDAFNREDLQGYWNLIFFGFTHCPDICPLTMAELKQFYEALEVNASDTPRVFLVTVDPERDNPESMKRYLADFNSEFIGLSGEPHAISQLASELYVVFEETAAGSSSHDHSDSEPSINTSASMNLNDYLISHSGHIAVVNPEGKYYAVMRAPHRNRDLVTAYLELIK